MPSQKKKKKRNVLKSQEGTVLVAGERSKTAFWGVLPKGTNPIQEGCTLVA
jgi:hypothetical protein